MSGHRIDVHHHILPPEYVASVGDARIGPLILAGRTPQWTPAQSVEAMDRNGIATAVTSISAPGLWFGDPRATRDLARHCNDYAAEMRRDHPGRFGLFASLPLPDIDASLREIEYALDVLKAEGIGLLTSYGSQYPGDLAFAPVFDELDRRKAVVYFHPTAAPCSQCLGEIPAATLEFPFDTTRAITSLLFGGTFARCRNICYIFSHAGGAVPFLAQRIARLGAKPEYKKSVPDGVIAELRRLYYDTALSANPFAFRALLELVPPAKVLFGSDYPFAPETTMTATVKGLAELGLDDHDLRAIERENALKLFPRFAAG
ncbi:MAG TPA: amidohydrolase family protein [Alphaproteobacteria bacterium]|nr:amidohydrolase family protein [Alphaproteobacteria bacterium]